MASDTTKLALRNQYFSLPDGPVKLQVAADFARLFGQLPEESLRSDQAISLRSTSAASGISFVDPTQFNAGSGIFDSTRRGVDASIGSRTNPDLGVRLGDVTGGRTNIEIPTPVAPPPPPPVIRNNEPECDYRYSFGCPEFSRRPNEAGCRILLPIYRTCFGKQNLYSVSGGSLSYAPELMGYIDISAYGQSVNESDPNFIENGVKGTRTINGTRFTADSLRLAIQDIGSYSTSQGFLPKFVDRPDLGEGIIGSISGTAPRGGTAALREFSQFDMTAIARNLQSVTTSAPPGFPPPVGDINSVADYWAKRCDLSKQPDYCFTSITFRPDQTTTERPRPSGGPFIDRRNRVEIPGTRKPTSETERIPVGGGNETPVKHPNKACILAIPRTYDDAQIWEVQYGYPVYSNSDFTGPIISYVPEGPSERYRVSRGIFTEYTNEVIDPNCGYKEIVHEYEEDDPSDKCFGIVKKDVSRLYEDGRQERVLIGGFVRYYRKQDADCAPETIKVYHPIDLGRDVMSAKIRAKTKGLFDGAQTLDCHHTSSTQPTASKTHYYEVTDCDSCGKTPYFAVAYGHNQGSGSTWAEGELNDTPTRAVYSQYRLLSLDLPETQFTFYTNGQPTASKDVYIMNFSRTGMSDRIDPGNFEIALAELRGGSYANNVFTGSNVAISSSNKVLTFIDDSDDRSDTISCTHDPYVSYDIISGSLTYGAYTTSSKHTYGIVYPNLGVIVLDPYKMNTELGFNTVTGSNIAGDNAFKLFTSISGSGVLGSYMKARNVKYKTTNHFFVRVSAPLGNFSNNPTYVSGSEGQFFHPCFDTNPQTYITSIGLYNDFNELLAVAKLSRPINKSFDNDVLVKIRLNW
jgi:hypothetical protein